MDFKANEGKSLAIEIDGEQWLRIPVKTHVVMKEDDLFGDVVDKYTKDIRRKGDIIFCSEKIIAISGGTTWPGGPCSAPPWRPRVSGWTIPRGRCTCGSPAANRAGTPSRG